MPGRSGTGQRPSNYCRSVALIGIVGVSSRYFTVTVWPLRDRTGSFNPRGKIVSPYGIFIGTGWIRVTIRVTSCGAADGEGQAIRQQEQKRFSGFVSR